jgi:hypothetical protein
MGFGLKGITKAESQPVSSTSNCLISNFRSLITRVVFYGDSLVLKGVF